MSQTSIDFGPIPLAPHASAGDLIVADRPSLGTCVLIIRGVYATAVTADRAEVIDRARARGESTPRTRPTTIAHGNYHIVTRGLRVGVEAVTRFANSFAGARP